MEIYQGTKLEGEAEAGHESQLKKAFGMTAFELEKSRSRNKLYSGHPDLIWIVSGTEATEFPFSDSRSIFLQSHPAALCIIPPKPVRLHTRLSGFPVFRCPYRWCRV